MARFKGTAQFAVNFEPGGQSPLDARLVVERVADLTSAATYAANNTYNGMVVAVTEDKSLYMLTDMKNITSTSSWKRLDAGASTAPMDSLRTELKGTENDEATSVTIYGTRKYAETKAATAETNAKSYADGLIAQEVKDRNSAISTAKNESAADATTKATTAETNAKSYADGLIAQEVKDRNAAISTAKNAAIEAASADASSKATTAETNAKSYADSKVNALNLNDAATANQFVTSVTQTKGQIAVTRAAATAEGIKVTDTASHFNTKTISAALTELYTQAGTGSRVACEVTTPAEGSVLKTYKFTQGGADIVTIDIAKDLVVKEGSVVKGTWTRNVFKEGSGNDTALKLVIANNESTPVYINTVDLVKDHTGGDGINISDTNVISIVKDPASESFLSVTSTGIKVSGVQTAIDTAKGAAVKVANDNKATIDAYTVNGTRISANPVLTGANIKATGYVKATTAAAITATDSVNVALGKLELGIDKAKEAASGDATEIRELITAIQNVDKAQDKKLATIQGTAETEGSIAKAQADAIKSANSHSDSNKATIDAYTVNSKRISTNPVLNGSDIALTGYTAPAKDDSGKTAAVSATDSVNAAIQKLAAMAVRKYVSTVTSGTSASILATAHKCGTTPAVKTYLNGNEVDCSVAINDNGDVTVSWNGNVVSTSAKLKIVVIG